MVKASVVYATEPAGKRIPCGSDMLSARKVLEGRYAEIPKG